MAWTNYDGLLVRFNAERGVVAGDGTSQYDKQVLKVDLDSQDLIGTADINADRPHLPANAIVTAAYVKADSAFTGTGTLTLGLANSTGTAIDADGIDAAIDVDVVLAAAGDVVTCDGALVDGTATIGAADAWVYGAVAGAVSAGTATLFIEYFKTE